VAEHLTFVAASAQGGVEAVWPDPMIVQRALHKLRWGANVELLDAVKEPKVTRQVACTALEVV